MKKLLEKLGQPIHIIIIKVVLSVLLIVAIFDQPYGYYEFLRFTVFFGSGFLAYYYWKFTEIGYISLYPVFIALGYNPFFPVHMDKGTWIVVDILVASLLFVSVFYERIFLQDMRK